MSATDDNRTAKQRKGTAAKLANIVLGVGQFGYATDTKETKVGDGVTTFALLPALGGGGGASYLKYVALISVDPVDGVTPTVLENTIGSISWTKTSAGVYTGFRANAFPDGLTVMFVQKTTSLVSFKKTNTSNVVITATGDPIDEYSVEIRVYP